MTTQTSERRLLAAGAGMAVGTLASRVTGFLRTAVLTAALSTGLLGDVYHTANTIPFVIYDLLLGGILTSVVVPLLVRARKRDPDGGVAYEQRLLTLVIVVLGAITVAAVLTAPTIIDLYQRNWTPAQNQLAVTLARFLLIQVFFLGLSALSGAMLNTRERFAAPMWAPVLNNAIIIAVGVIFLTVSAAAGDPARVTAGEARLLGLGTLAGAVAQTAALWPALRASGFTFRLRFDFGNARFGEMGRMAAGAFAYVVITQIGFLVIVNLANGAGVLASRGHVEHGAGFTPYFNAYQVFQLPYAIIAVSVVTALLPRMSGHAAEGRVTAVRDHFSSGVRLAAALLVPAAMVLLALGPAITVLLFGHGNASIADAYYVGEVLRAFALGLVPFSIFQLLLRVFYALGDTRTPAVIAMGNVAVSTGLGLASYHLLPAGGIVVGIAAGVGAAYAVGTVTAWVALRRRLHGLDGRRIAGALARMHLAALPGFIGGLAVLLGVTKLLGTTTGSALAALIIGSLIAGLGYLVFARWLKVTEVRTILGLVFGRFRSPASGG